MDYFLEILPKILKIIIVPIAAVSGGAILVFAERRVAGLMQGRRGPNELPMMGMGVLIADMFKTFLKEEMWPERADKFTFFIAPMFSFMTGMITFAIIPFAGWDFNDPNGSIAGIDVGVGILWFLAFGSLAVYGIAYGGWSSNCKYSQLSGLRAVAQLISFEVAMVLTIISIVMTTESLHMHDIVMAQTYTNMENKDLLWGFLPNWLVFRQPLAFILFLAAGFGEINRNPFDLPEADQELVGGYYTEYSSWKFGSFMFADYVAAMPFAGLITVFFFGGWHIPYLETLISPLLFNV